MDSKTSLAILQRVRTESVKLADGTTDAFAGAVQNMASSQLQSDAMKDVRNLFLASLGAGLAGRGAVGLFNTLGRGRRKKTETGSTSLAMPYPAVPKMAGFLGGDLATSKPGIPWYGPAMMLGGMAGLGAGWKGLDAVLEKRRKSEREQELGQARQDFHDALMSQYAKPVSTHESLLPNKTAADETTMTKIGQDLDTLWQRFSQVLGTVCEKEAIDWGNLAGTAAGGYGTYAGLSGLLTGAFIYDKINKRSRGAVLEKAMQRRRRREFMQRPTEIFATPEPMLNAQRSELEPSTVSPQPVE